MTIPQEFVDKELDTALYENGHEEFRTMDPWAVAVDMMTCSSVWEEMEWENPNDLVPYVTDWQKRRAHS